MGRRGAVATSHPLAAQVGLRILQDGGNAVDAAVATAAALTVLEPTSNGIGGDAFALVWDGRRLHGLNASGRAPQALTPEVFFERGLDRVPTDGWLPVTVPGAVSAWAELARRFGSMPLKDLVEPAARYAEEGHPVPPVIARSWRAAAQRFGHRDDFRQTFLPWGRPPKAGELCAGPDPARTLRLIGESDGEAFYRGELARAIARYAAQTGGYITEEDLAAHRPEWVEPISTSYRGFQVWEIPPNGQGLAALLALNILEGTDVASLPHLSAKQLHLVAEALKLAFADAHRYIADPARSPVPTRELLDKGYAARRRALIAGGRALAEPQPGLPRAGDTVYLCAADSEGRMVSYIQSNYMGFGSGVVVPGTGIALHNRGAGFTLEEGHPNRVAPGQRPYHTIIPGFLSKNGVPLAAFGVMGGDMQPQGHVQVVTGIIDYGLNPQAALDAPRIRVAGARDVHLESSISKDTARQLADWGHQVHMEFEDEMFGGGQIIWRDPDTGVFIAGSEPRKDGSAAAW
ncbi:MAG: gamma-glutamyltransferase [Firmicutes bacterium]|nr:gamma-glutamyltransferase [Bacillota bacterium]